MTMIYVKTSGEYGIGDHDFEDELIRESGCETLENALTKLDYHFALSLGKSEEFKFELYLNDDSRIDPAAIGFMNYIGTYEIYAFESKHAAITFIKDYSLTITNLNNLITSEI